MKNYLGREDTLNGIVGGVAVGAVLGLKSNSGVNALKYGALFAGEAAGERGGCASTLWWHLCLAVWQSMRWCLK
jgi:hypothetical protein